MSTSTYRLPTHVSPIRYDIQLNAEVRRETFHGHENIMLELHQPCNRIDLHAKGLTVTDVHLQTDGQDHLARVIDDKENERIVLEFPQELPTGTASVYLAFQGKVSQTLKGLYLAQNPPEQVLCTQCEATDARAVFPCFDEPTFKAQFAIEVTTPDPVVLSNTPLLSVKDNGGSKIWSFASTKKMSSYLVALVIGDLASTEEKVVNGIPLRVWSMRGKEQLGSFAREYAARLLPWYENYFAAPYHFDKYDQVAVPGFAAGAMENSGLVTFRQELLLMDPESSPWLQQKIISLIVAHEFAHMWFGNLVTMQWWDDIWLNEAFAQWMAFRVISELSPEYRLWDDFQAEQHFTLAADSLANTHPIYTPVQTPAQAEELFDGIVYMKGCAVLRMLETFLGSDVFCAGLRAYMHEFTESNARGVDLWRHLQTASQQPVVTLMESWILQSGHPCVTVTLETDGEGTLLRMDQKRFFANPQTTGDPQVWQIPMAIRYVDEAGTHHLRHILTDVTGTVMLPVQGELHWCYPNGDQIGFYRLNISGSLLKKLLENLEQLTPGEQMGLLGDQWALTHRGDQTITQFLQTLRAMAIQTKNHNVLAVIVERLHTLEQMVEDLENHLMLEEFRRWVGRLFRQRLNTLGYEPRPGEPVEVSQLRVSVMDALGTLAHDPDVIAQAAFLAEREAADPQSVDPNLANMILHIHAQFGDEAVFRKYVDVYQQRKASGAVPQTVTRYVYNFPAFRSLELVTHTLSLLDEGIAPKEALYPLMYLMFNSRHAQTTAWHYVKTNWQTIKEMGLGTGQIIKYAGNLPYSLREDFVEFCETHVRGVADMSYEQALENIDLLAGFQARTKNDLVAWLSQAAN